MRTKKYSDCLNIAQSIHWVKKQESLAKPECQICGNKEAIGFDFKEHIVNTICARGHKSTWYMTVNQWTMMKRLRKLFKQKGHLKY